MKKLKLKWEKAQNDVYRASNGFSIHVNGLIKIGPTSKDFRIFDCKPQNEGFERFNKMYGFNKKRALMAWAESFAV